MYRDLRFLRPTRNLGLFADYRSRTVRKLTCSAHTETANFACGLALSGLLTRFQPSMVGVPQEVGVGDNADVKIRQAGTNRGMAI